MLPARLGDPRMRGRRQGSWAVAALAVGVACALAAGLSGWGRRGAPSWTGKWPANSAKVGLEGGEGGGGGGGGGKKGKGG